MKKYIGEFISLRENTDFEKTISTISEGVSLKGYNFWILICSTILASIGLDLNSTAVIIGAMLISPLMSPILGVGLSVAIHDKSLLIRSLRDLFVAVLISLSASVLYFFLSPLGEPTTELQARTFPTLLDVLIALFGGIAGIVSISRHDQTNAIPGVAIATALMPPLCTAGFGIATGHWNYFFGAFYLFFINAVFISLATYLIVSYLHFPEKEFVDKKTARKYRRSFIIFSMIALAPSIYFLYSVYKNEVIKKDIQSLILLPITKQGNEILKWEEVSKDTSKLIKVYYSGRQLSDSFKKSIDSALILHKMKMFHLVSTRVNLTKEEVSELSAETARQMFDEMHLEELKAQSQVQKIKTDTIPYAQIVKETRLAFPFLDTLAAGTLISFLPENKNDTLPIFFFKSRRALKNAQKLQVYNYLLLRTSNDTIVLTPF